MPTLSNTCQLRFAGIENLETAWNFKTPLSTRKIGLENRLVGHWQRSRVSVRTENSMKTIIHCVYPIMLLRLKEELQETPPKLLHNETIPFDSRKDQRKDDKNIKPIIFTMTSFSLHII